MTALGLLTDIIERIRAQQHDNKCAKTAGRTAGTEESNVNNVGALEAEVFFDPNEINLHPGRSAALLSWGICLENNGKVYKKWMSEQ